MSKMTPLDIIKGLDKEGFVFNFESIAKDAHEKGEFRTAIDIDVEKYINELSPYALSIVCGNNKTYVAIIKCKLVLSGGGVAVASYGVCKALDASLCRDKILVDKNKVIVISKESLIDTLINLYSTSRNKDCLDDLIFKFYNLSSPTFETEGNELFSDDAEKMSTCIFEDKDDPIGKAFYDFIEDDIINFDLYAKENGLLKERGIGRVRYVTEQGRTLDVININRHAGENALGVDLIYFLREYRSLVMLQYKRLNEKKTYYTSSDGNYKKEIERMLSTRGLFDIPKSKNPEIAHRYFRLNSCPYYFKMCPSASGTTNRFVTGACINLDYWLDLMNSVHCQTDQGNNRLCYPELDRRYLTALEFIDLTKRGLLGGYIAGVDDLWKIVIELVKGKHIVVTSIESPKQGYVDV